MDRVVRLPESVANQIAAGEVVERPASVVKELVENAVDAGATRIEIDVEQGGQRRIRVVDDGEGMSPRDAVACLERHATSKIRAAEDLITVKTLGFRGEALPSIASVSRFQIVTRRRDQDVATRVRVEGTEAPRVDEVGAPVGTAVEVSDLFFNVPARRKFLRRPSTEMGHVTEAATRLALATPEVGFKLRAQDRGVLDVPAGDPHDPRGRIGRVLGQSAAERLLPIPPDDRPHRIEVRGFISEPGYHERTSRSLYVFLNGRFIRDRGVHHAILEAYRTLMERGRFPVAVVWLSVPSDTFDVNVHPQKTEVRFGAPQDVHRAVFGALSRALDAGLGRPSPVSATRWAEAVAEASGPSEGRPRIPSGAGAGVGPVRGSALHRRASFEAQAPWPRPEGPVPMFLARDGSAETRGHDPAEAGKADAVDGPAPAVSTEDNAEERPLGLAFGRYLVVERGPRLALVDLPAVLQRRSYEALMSAPSGRELTSQRLLVPLVVELSAAGAERARDLSEELLRVGFEVEDFGGTSVAVTAHPADVDGRDVPQLLSDLLSSDEGAGPDAAARRRERWARRTARAAGPRLPATPVAWQAILQELQADGRLRRSLEGRPTVVELSRGSVERLFEDGR